MAKIDLKSKTIPEIEAFLAELGEPKFRAKQIFVWMHKGVESFDEMTLSLIHIWRLPPLQAAPAF